MFKRRHVLKTFLAVMVITGLTFGANLAFAQTGLTLVDKIVAVVNDDIITAVDINKRLRPIYTQIAAASISEDEKNAAREQVRGDVLNEMIREKLMEQEMLRNNIRVSDEEVNAAINDIKSKNDFSDEALRDALALQGYSYEDYRDEIQRQILSSKLMNRQIRSRVVVTEADIERYYNENSGDFLSAREYKIWNLFVRWSQYGDEREQRQAVDTIQKLYNQLQNGTDFISLVQKAGQTYGGGELGFYRLNEVAEAFRPVIAGLEPHSYSTIVPGPGVAQIFYVEEIQIAENQPMEEVRPEIEEILYRQGMEKRFENWMQELYDQSHIEILEN